MNSLWTTMGLNMLSLCILVALSLTFIKRNAAAKRGEIIIENAAGFHYTI